MSAEDLALPAYLLEQKYGANRIANDPELLAAFMNATQRQIGQGDALISRSQEQLARGQRLLDESTILSQATAQQLRQAQLDAAAYASGQVHHQHVLGSGEGAVVPTPGGMDPRVLMLAGAAVVVLVLGIVLRSVKG